MPRIRYPIRTGQVITGTGRGHKARTGTVTIEWLVENPPCENWRKKKKKKKKREREISQLGSSGSRSVQRRGREKADRGDSDRCRGRIGREVMISDSTQRERMSRLC